MWIHILYKRVGCFLPREKSDWGKFLSNTAFYFLEMNKNEIGFFVKSDLNIETKIRSLP